MWPVALSGRLPVEALVGRRPANKLIGRDPIPFRKSLPDPPCEGAEHPALPPVSRSYSGEWGRLVTHYSPVRHSHPQASLQDPVRLACVKHAASVRPEPESNPPRKNHGRAERLQNKETTKKPNPMQDTGKGHRTKTGTGSSPPAPTPKRRRPRPTGNQMTCKVAQNTLLSSQTTTTHEAGQPDPAGRRPSKQQEKNIHHPPQKHKPPTNPHPKNPTNKPPPTACRTHPQTHHTTTQTTPKQLASNNKSLTTRRVATAEPGTSYKHTRNGIPTPSSAKNSWVAEDGGYRPTNGISNLRHRRPINHSPKTEVTQSEKRFLTSDFGESPNRRRRRKLRIPQKGPGPPTSATH